MNEKGSLTEEESTSSILDDLKAVIEALRKNPDGRPPFFVFHGSQFLCDQMIEEGFIEWQGRPIYFVVGGRYYWPEEAVKLQEENEKFAQEYFQR
jgi:hypothetical protein